jgi:hypothetical protein
LLSATAGGALIFGSILTAAPAFAVPTTAACVAAQTQLNTDTGLLQTARNQLASDRAVGATNTQIAIDNAAISQASAVVAQDQAVVNVQCGTTGGTGAGNGFPRPRPVPVPAPVGLGSLNCAQLAARGLHDIPAGSVYYRTALDGNNNGVACETTPTATIPVGTFRVVNGQNCKWSGTTWVPVTPPPATVVVDPCNCTPTTDPQPAQIIVKQQQPIVTQTVVEQAPVVVPPAQVFTTPQAPSVGAVATGDGSLADVINPIPVIPDPGTVTITLDLGNVLNIVRIPGLPLPLPAL